MDRDMAGDRPPPYGDRTRPGARSARACPSRSLDLPGARSARACPSRGLDRSVHGGGQAPALRCMKGLRLNRSARACPSRSLDLRVARSARACPSRSLDRPMHGGGQAPALRCMKGLLANPRPRRKRNTQYGYFIFNLFNSSASNHLNREFRGRISSHSFKPVLITVARGSVRREHQETYCHNRSARETCPSRCQGITRFPMF